MKKIVRVCSLLLMLSMVLSGCGASQTTAAEAETMANVVETDVETEAMASVVETDVETETMASETETAVGVENEANVAEADAEATTDAEKEEEVAVEKTDSTVLSEEEVTEPVAEIVVTPFEQAKTMYATIALNVRKGPSTDYEVVGHLANGQAAEVTGQADTGWYQIVVNGENAFVSHRYMSETKIEAPAPAPVQQAVAQPAQPTATVAPAGVIMVGDSRCVQMQAAVGGGGCSWVCENSKEYTWFTETAIPKFDQYVGKGTKVVINMGVNDPEHYKQYAEFVNAKAAEWAQRGARTYFVSVNPVWENPYTTQEQVDTFNANVPGLLSGVTWIDTCSWLTTNGYRLKDGLHFDDPTSVNIFNLIMGSL